MKSIVTMELLAGVSRKFLRSVLPATIATAENSRRKRLRKKCFFVIPSEARDLLFFSSSKKQQIPRANPALRNDIASFSAAFSACGGWVLEGLRPRRLKPAPRARGNYFFKPAAQLVFTVMGTEADCSVAVLIKKRWPSLETS